MSHSRLPPADPALENEKLVAQLKLARDEIDRLKAHNNNLIQCLLESERAFARLKALNEKGGKRKRDLPSPFKEGPDADESASKTEEGPQAKFFENLVCGMSKPQEEKEEEEKPRKKARTRRNRPARWVISTTSFFHFTNMSTETNLSPTSRRIRPGTKSTRLLCQC